jgi:hypothetical protein
MIIFQIFLAIKNLLNDLFQEYRKDIQEREGCVNTRNSILLKEHNVIQDVQMRS